MAASARTDIDQNKSIYQKSVIPQKFPSLNLQQLKINEKNYYQSPNEPQVYVKHALHLLYH